MEAEREFVDQFVMEAREHLDTIEDDFLKLENQRDNPDQTLVDKVFRAIHSIKGASGFLGLTKIGNLAHVMETLLSMMRAGEVQPESEFIDALLSGADILGAMVDDVEHSNETDITKIHDRLASLLARVMSPKVKHEMNTPVKLSGSEGDDIGFDINEFTLKNIPPNMSLYVLKYDLTELSKKEHKSPVALIRDLLSTGEIIDAKLDIPFNDLRSGLPQAPLVYEVLYATFLLPDDIQEIAGLPEDRVSYVERGDSAGVIPISSGFRVPSFNLRTPVSETPLPEQSPHPQAVVINREKRSERRGEKAEEGRERTGDKEEKTEKRADDNQPATTEDSRQLATGTEKPQVLPDIEPEQEPHDAGVDLSSSVRIHVDILDKLMMLVGELVLVRNQQILSMENADPVSQFIAQRLDAVTTELQETVMRTRMQSIGKIFRKFPRIIRTLGKAHGKYIRITLNGSKVELDKTILESLTDPLTHLIRNSCDHGIESPEERTRAGKPETGHITLGAWHEAGHINIEIRDDGRGINPDIIRQKALEKRLKTVTELNRMSDNEILRLILLPGFSTADKVSELSGRGVGMDVVKTGIEKLGGIIDLESAVGEGTGIHLRLPLTLAIIPCLIVISGEDRYAIPQVNLVELVCLYDEDVHTKIEIADNQEVYRLRDRLLHMVRFSEVLARPAPFATEVVSEIIEKSRTSASAFRAGPEDQEASLNFAVLKVGTGRFGLIIDHVLGTEEIVVKPMHPALKSLNIYSGATVMGDGKVALILDIEGIAAHAGVITGTRADELHTDTVENDDDLQTVLLFKYGEKEHFAMTLPLIRRIERISTFHIEEIGEKEFITINNISTRILRLDQVLDVSTGTERDGMFLILPRYIRRPVGLLASRLVDIEETSVQLNTESYMEDGIMGTSVIRGHITLFIDIYRLIEKVEPEWFADRRMGLFGMPGPPDKELLAHNESEKRVLLVEDASFFRQLIKSYLEADGYEVITAENGKIGLERINETSFKLVVSDIEMPVMDGWNFVKHLRGGKRQQNIPTVALTALDSENDREKAKRCGFDRYEVKIDRERFLTTVAELMGRMKSEV